VRRVVVPVVSALLFSGLAATAPAHAAVLCDVKGTLQDVHGKAVPAATLNFSSDTGDVTVKTTSTGAFSASAPCGTAQVTISWTKAPLTSLPASAHLRGKAKLVDGHSYALRLPAAVTASLTVTDPDGKPVANALVAQQNEDETYTANPATVLTGASDYSVWLDLPGRRTDSTGKVAYLTFPITAMALAVYPPAGSVLRHASVTIDASRAGSHTLKLPLLTSGPSASGVVLDSAGHPVPGLYISVGDDLNPAKTDANGHFTVYGDAGPATLGVGTQGASNLEPISPYVPTNFMFGAPVVFGSGAPVTITLPPVSHIRIHVHNAEGWPQGGVSLQCRTTAGNCNPGWITSDPATVVPGAPAQRIIVDVEPPTSDGGNDGVIEYSVFPTTSVPPMSLNWITSEGDDLYADVPALDGRTDRDITVTMPPVPKKYTVTGSITDADGHPITGLRLLPNPFSFTDPDATGHFSLPVAEGHTTLTVWRETWVPGWTASATLPASFTFRFPLNVSGDRTATLRLPRTYTVTMHVFDPVDHKPVAAYLDKWDDDDFASTIPNLTVAGADGPATVAVYLRQAQTQQPGASELHWWSQSMVDDILVQGAVGKTTLKSRVIGLDVTRDKEFDVVLGTSSDPSTYQRPGAVTDLTAQPQTTTSTTSVRTIVAATSTASVAVHWAPPKHTGGLPIKGYLVTASPGGKSVKVGKSTRQAVVTGLTAGTKYTFKVQAINVVGTAKGSSTHLDTAAPTAKVTAPHATSTHKKSATFTWIGADDASGVASYDVRVRSVKHGKGKWHRLVMGTKKTRRSIDLRAGYTTCVSVRAIDKVGRVGHWSAPRCISRPAD